MTRKHKRHLLLQILLLRKRKKKRKRNQLKLKLLLKIPNFCLLFCCRNGFHTTYYQQLSLFKRPGAEYKNLLFALILLEPSYIQQQNMSTTTDNLKQFSIGTSGVYILRNLITIAFDLHQTLSRCNNCTSRSKIALVGRDFNLQTWYHCSKNLITISKQLLVKSKKR